MKLIREENEPDSGDSFFKIKPAVKGSGMSDLSVNHDKYPYQKNWQSEENLMRLFVDSSAFLALEDKDDENHESAIEFRSNVRDDRPTYRMLYTTNYIFDETITLIRMQLGHAAAISFGDAIIAKLVTILWVSPVVDSEAWGIFKKYRGKDFSYTDCTSSRHYRGKKLIQSLPTTSTLVSTVFKLFPRTRKYVRRQPTP